ncbi:MAG TPA: hypothetical protein VFZ54_09930 [Burkholderiales bacterium]
MRTCLIVALAVALAACGGAAQMIPAGEPPAMRPGEALVVFMRPSNFGGLVASSVFDVTTPETKFVAIVYPGQKFAHAVAPGEHTFMVIGESADFMRATVTAGRTYYALVTPRVGVWKARFSFRPVRESELGGSEFASWDATTQFVTNSPASLDWAQKNAADVNSKRSEYWAEWMSKPAHQQASQTLNPPDGKVTAAAAATGLAPRPAAAPAPALPSSPVVPSEAGVETMFWESIRQSSNPADFRAYLEQYPQGRFAPLARNRLAALGQTPPPTPAPASSPRSSGPLPQAGDSWTYRLTEPKRVDGPKQRDYTVKVVAASPSAISEEYAIDGGVSGKWTHKGARDIVPVGMPVFAPYLIAFGEIAPGALGRVQVAEGACGAAYLCQASGQMVRREPIKVAAGTFDTVRVEIQQSWRPAAMSGQQGGQNFGARTLTVWYSVAAKRAVKYSSRATAGNFPPIDTDFELELVSYRVR